MNTEKFIYALGFFDGVHRGHQALLRSCRELADRYGCKAGVVTFSNHPDGLVQGEAPKFINSASDRERLLKQYHMDRVVELPFDDTLRSMSWVMFLVMLNDHCQAYGFVCGADFRFGHKGAGTAELLEEYCRTEWLPYAIVPEQTLNGITVSSTHIRSLITGGRMEQAVEFLGHPHILTGEVVPGRQLGRTIGVPTANLLLPEGIAVPKAGVYCCRAKVDGVSWPAVTNIGSRPTVGGHQVRAESWLLGYEGDLYGRQITLEFYKFLRPEQKFDSLEALKVQIRADAEETRRFFR